MYDDSGKCANGKKLYLRADNHFGFHDTLEEGNGPLIWLEKTTNSLCPSDNLNPFGFWNVLTEDLELSADPYQVSWASDQVMPTQCTEIDVSGSVAQHFGYNCLFKRQALIYNDYPVFEVCKWFQFRQ